MATNKENNRGNDPVTETESPKGLVSKLCEVLAEVGRIQKNGRNEFHSYDYVLEADLMDKIRPLLAERGVFVFPTLISTCRTLNECKEQGKRSYLTDVLMKYTFRDGETGEDLSVEFPGCGEDAADKGAYKAMTGAEKYFLTKTFMVSTGDDPEKETDNPPPNGAPPRNYKLNPQSAEPLTNPDPEPNGTVKLQGIVGATYEFEGKDKNGNPDGSKIYNAEINGRKVWTKYPVLGAELLDNDGTEVIATLKPSKNKVNVYQLLTLELPS